MLRPEFSGAVGDDLGGEVDHFGIDLKVGDVAEIFVGGPDLIGIAQNVHGDALVECSHRHQIFAARHGDLAKAELLLLGQRRLDHEITLILEFVLGQQIIGRLEIARVDLFLRDEFLQVQRLLALELHRIEFFGL